MAVAAFAPRAAAQAPDGEDPATHFGAPAADPVARLQKRVDAGEVTLGHDGANGYLSSLLKVLDIPASSQTLVFSKTSFQRDRISPATPRAIFFNDETYVGWVPGGDVLELASTDPRLGTVFYTLDQRAGVIRGERPADALPRFARQTHSCLQCHGPPMTRDVPGLLVRSVYADATGQPVLSAGTFATTQQSPLSQRWGGWYVTGTHGRQRHMGNVFVPDDAPDPAAALDVEAGANVADLAGRFDASAYPGGARSDIAALMVLEHQAQMHNLLTRAQHHTLQALRDEAAMDASLGRPADELSETTAGRIRDAGEPVVRYMLFCDEAALGKIEGSAEFRKDFESRGPRDGDGRSLRQLDLKRRLFKYPCSYLIYSPQFDALPAPVKDYVHRRLWEVLSGADDSDDFSHLPPATRRAVLQILLETKAGLPDYWKPVHE